MIAIISLLTVLVFSLLVVRIATVALTMTGLSRELARFQARSAFTGAGFTTSESEQVVHHPVRRRIIMLLMLLGNAGIVTAMSTLMLSFVNVGQSETWSGSLGFRLLVLGSGLTALWYVAYSQWVDRRMSQLIGWALKRWTTIEVRDYAGLLHLAGDYIVIELTVEPADWLANRTLAELKLSDEGVLVLGIEKANHTYIGAPRGPHVLEPDDTVILYGRQEVLVNLDERRAGAAGNWEHHKTVDRQQRVEQEVEQEIKQELEQQSPPESGSPSEQVASP